MLDLKIAEIDQIIVLTTFFANCGRVQITSTIRVLA